MEDLELAQQAITFALKGDWPKALEANLKLFKLAPDNIDTLNRLARAYAETGRLQKAKKVAQKALILDPLNSIAIKHLDRWKNMENMQSMRSTTVVPNAFLEEPGKTKIVELINPGSITVIQTLDCGDEVKLFAHSHRISVNSPDGKLVGRLPDDLSNRLIKLIKFGNEYQTFIKSIKGPCICIFIREIKRSKKLQNIASFKNA